MNNQKIFQLPHPSDEQLNAIYSAQNNIIVDSVAGSGKTTTILHLATAYPNDTILLLTYNKKLKLETRKKIDLLGLRNIEAHSYHSCAVKYYDPECYDDYKMIHVVNSGNNRIIRLPAFNRIIIDEAQDMTELYFKFVCLIVRDLPGDKSKLQFSIIGDKFQSIFAFNGADRRFIQYADVLFAGFTAIPKWIAVKLSTSYRITREMAAFINLIALKDNRLKAVKDGPPVQYIVCNTFGQYPSEVTHKLLNSNSPVTGKKYGLDDIFIIAPSVKSARSPVRKVANYLSSLKIPIFVPGTDEEPLDEDVLRGKVVFSTFHQVKGLERKIVIVFGFDAAYFDYFAKNAARDTCPNTLYVAITRAIEQMYIFHHNGHDFLPFIDQERLLSRREKYVDVLIKDKLTEGSSKIVNNVINVSELTRHISAKIVCDAMNFFQYTEVVPASNDIDIPIRIDGLVEDKNTLTETVAEINGVALVAYFEYISTGDMQILNELIREYDKRGNLQEIQGLLVDQKTGEQDFVMTPENLLRLANQYCSFRSNYIYKMNQIKKYDWLQKEHLEAAMKRMKGHLSGECEFEIEVQSLETILGKSLHGRLDIYDKANNTLWEIKAVKALKFEHLIQTVIYGYLFQIMLEKNVKYQCKYLGISNQKADYIFVQCKDPMKVKCFNILNGQIMELIFDQASIYGMLQMIIYSKYFDGKSEKDDDFMREILTAQIEHLKPFDPNRVKPIPPPITKKITDDSKQINKILDDDWVF